MKLNEVKKLISKLKNAITNELNEHNYENALSLISTCGNILYQSNIYYMDNDLEHALERVAKELRLNKFMKLDHSVQDDVLLFWDGFGFNDRGLIQIYMRALCKFKKVVYVTYSDRKDQIPDVLDILDQYQAEHFYIERSNQLINPKMNQLNSIVEKVKPGHMFFYTTPDDVTATPILYAYDGIIKRYQINLTDHAFWLGAGCIDTCIESRDYGAKISKQYRGFPEKKIAVIPFYPIVHYEKEFQGYPFEVKAGQKVIFSGGALYKTLGGENKYYIIVDHILNQYKNAVLWYAGTGDDSEMKKIISKYPGRAYLTAERSDLYQVIEHCHFYLSTYPMWGGLMLQFAAMGGKVPVTLKYGNISDSTLINQADINVEFTDIEDLYAEVDRLMTDEAYVKDRSELMRKAVIAPEVFDEEVYKLVTGKQNDSYQVDYKDIDTESFRQWYLDRLQVRDLNMMLVRKNAIKSALKYYPIRFVRGGASRVVKLIKQKFSNR